MCNAITLLMGKMKHLSLKRLQLRQIHATSQKDSRAARLSNMVLYTLAAVVMAVFGLFFTVGYDQTFEEDADFNAPMFTDVVLAVIYLFAALALVLAVGSAIKQLKNHNRCDDVVNNVPAKRIALGCAALLAVCMGLTFALGNTSPIVTNGTAFADSFWLRTADMFINTIVMLMVVAAAIVALCLCGVNRKL